VIHDAHGFWIADAGGGPPPLAPLRENIGSDVLVVGGGFAGLWAAWHVTRIEPDARVTVLEAGRCGFGPSGRNAGFVNSLWLSLPGLIERFGRERGVALARASADSVRSIGDWCAQEGVDARYRSAPHPVVSAAPAQDGVGSAAASAARELDREGGGEPEVRPLLEAEVRSICASPVLRGGVVVRTAATIDPARLVFGLRGALLAAGVRIFEGTRVRALRATGSADTVAETEGGGAVRAGAVILAVGARSGALAPLRRSLTVASSHIVITEPVPDVIESLGWTGGEAITDGRALLHYFRTTPDDRILFGWAGGRMAAGARAGRRMEVDRQVVAHVRADLLRTFPALAGRRLDHAWGGPIDVSPSHLPSVVPLPGAHRVHAAFGFTGNGVGPSHLAGRALASLALDRRDDASRLAFVDPPATTVPPEPARIAGATLVRRALVAKEAAEEAGGRAGPLTRAVADLPARLGLHLVR
jgi:glycine/D-amino acid oxidase-like deaminating enzyme